MPVASVHTLNAQIEAGLSSERILGYLSGLFAALSTLLAGIGLYGVLSYSVTRRTREIGVRFAIGAQTSDVAVLFARESFILFALGLIIGSPLALMSMQVLKGLLFGVNSTDASTLFLSVCVLASATFLAIAVPLWRAARVNPLIALRYE
jgi:ABC-type antimicrobial peptide transport system permease subunit